MTAHDDDQDLVTIRIPRKAAAMYASELDVLSSPWMIGLATYGRAAAGLATMIAALCFAAVGVYQLIQSDVGFAGVCFAFTVIWGGVGGFLFLYGLSQFAAAERRRLL